MRFSSVARKRASSEAVHHATQRVDAQPDRNCSGCICRARIEHYRVVEENQFLRQRLASMGECPDIIGSSTAMHEVFNRIRQIADTLVTVLIQGESGTGKELVARAIHNLSGRKTRPFVAANVSALPESLVESELFGYEKGAFTGASRQKLGWFEIANGGTLFLDELGEMPQKAQVDLLRVLEQREIRRLGGEKPIPVDVRLVAATHRDINELVATGNFREDLFYRIKWCRSECRHCANVATISPRLIEYFLQQSQQRHSTGTKTGCRCRHAFLCNHSWPGNVRQLRNVIERLVVTVDGPVIHVEDLPDELRATPRHDTVTLEAAVEEAEKAAILAALAKCNQHRGGLLNF